jgi:hypothetical protein
MSLPIDYSPEEWLFVLDFNVVDYISRLSRGRACLNKHAGIIAANGQHDSGIGGLRLAGDLRDHAA